MKNIITVLWYTVTHPRDIPALIQIFWLGVRLGRNGAMSNTTKKLDATKYMWKPFGVTGQSGYFDFLKPMEAKGEVFFDERSFERMDYFRNGVSMSFYGTGSVDEYAAMELTDGRILFCVVRGSKFTDTFHSADSIEMQYWTLEPL